MSATTYEISRFRPCQEAMEYRATHDSFEQAWQSCPRGDWMLWLASRLGVDKRTLTLAKALCAKTVIHLMTDERSCKAVEVAEAYGRGVATDDELRSAYAASAYAASADAAAASAAYAYAYAAAASAAYAAAAAADAYAAAAYDAAADGARKQNQKATADICREVLTDAVMSLIKEQK